MLLDGGAKLYQSLVMNSDGKLVPDGCKRKEHAQRMHFVECRGDGIYVSINKEGSCDSDRYSSLRSCMPRVGMNRRTTDHAYERNANRNLHSRMPLRSGYVLNKPKKGKVEEQSMNYE